MHNYGAAFIHTRSLLGPGLCSDRWVKELYDMMGYSMARLEITILRARSLA